MVVSSLLLDGFLLGEVDFCKCEVLGFEMVYLVDVLEINLGEVFNLQA